jgi:menaquinone-dependent protoporphyrinogen oxidase
MSSILVVYASHYGQTRAIAERLAQRLREHRHEVDVVNAEGDIPPPQDYDVVVLGSRVELGRHASCVLDFVRLYRAALHEMPTAFFSVSMAATRPEAGPDPDGYMVKTFSDLGWQPTLTASFAGGLPYRKYGFFMRFVMKRISKSAGHTTDTSRDHEFTDWTEVSAFADNVAYLAVLVEAPEESVVHPN